MGRDMFEGETLVEMQVRLPKPFAEAIADWRASELPDMAIEDAAARLFFTMAMESLEKSNNDRTLAELEQTEGPRCPCCRKRLYAMELRGQAKDALFQAVISDSEVDGTALVIALMEMLHNPLEDSHLLTEEEAEELQKRFESRAPEDEGLA